MRALFNDESGEYLVSGVAGMAVFVIPVALALFVGQERVGEFFARIVHAASMPLP